MSVAPRRLAARALAAIYPATGRVPGLEPARAEELLARLDAAVPLRTRLLFGACLALFLVTPLLTVRRPALALSLSRELLDEHADRLTRSRSYACRQAMLLLKTVGGLAWGADPAVRAALGFRPYGPDPGTRRTA